MNSTRNNNTTCGNPRRLLGTLALALALSAGVQSAIAQTLPPPDTVVSGIPVATQYDDGYSYSTRLLDYLYPGSGWSDSAGTGQLDLIVTTRSSGQSNTDLGYSIPEPTTNPNTNPINDSWGTADTTGPMLVKDLYDYLFDTFGANTPVFTFDQNETGGSPNLFVSAIVEIIDPNAGVGGTSSVLKSWSFDAAQYNSSCSGYNGGVANSTYDPSCPVTAPGTITVPDVMDTEPGPTVTFDNNKGSGKFDFIIYVPTMDLSLWDDTATDGDNIFKLSWVFDQVDDGGEEITITGRFTPGNVCVTDPTLPQCQTIPEPHTLALISLGMLGIAFAGRRRRPVIEK